MTMRRASLIAAAVLAVTACEAEDPEPEASPAEEPAPDDTDPAEPAPDDAAAEDPAEPPEVETLGPPSDEIGIPVAVDPVVFDGADAVVALAGVSVYREGMEVHVAVRWDPEGEGRSPQAEPGGPLGAIDLEDPPASEEELPEELLRVELVHPDGSVASTVEALLARTPDQAPQEPVLETHSGMGDETSWDEQLWTYPRPEPGDATLQFDVRWPVQGIDERRDIDLTVEELDAAADRVITPWQ
jgi:hypothetical protein